MTRKASHRWVAILVAAAVALTTVLVLRRRETSTPSAVETAKTPPIAAFRFAWPRGARHVFDFRWQSDLQIEVGLGNKTTSKIDVGGVAELRSFGPRGASTLLGLRFTRVDHHVFTMLGADLFAEPDAVEKTFAKTEAWLEVAADGRLVRILYRRDAPMLFKAVAEAVAEQGTITLPAGGESAWSAVEITPTGRADVRYAVTDGMTTALGLVRERTAYESLAAVPNGCADCRRELAAKAEIALDPAGFLARIADEESLTLTHPSGATALRSKVSFVMTHTQAGTFDAPTDTTFDMTALESRAPGQPMAGSGASEGALLDRRVAGLTFEDLASTVDSYAAGGGLPKGFTLRASGLLLRDPELATRFPAMFGAQGATDKGRELLLDLLASAGTQQAQAAMRASLELPVASRDPAEYRALLQRFSFIEKPEAASVDFVEGQYASARRRGDEATQLASAYSLGALSAALGRQGDDARASSVATRLRNDLAEAKTTRAKSNLVTALGEARRSEDVPRLAAHSRDAAPEVRASAARALGKSPVPEAKKAVRAMLGDPDLAVSSATLSALDEQGFGPDDLTAVTDAVRNESLPRAADPALVSLLAKNAGAADVRPTLELLLARAKDREEQARIRYVVAQLDARRAGR